jgi:hypothetical protein
MLAFPRGVPVRMEAPAFQAEPRLDESVFSPDLIVVTLLSYGSYSSAEGGPEAQVSLPRSRTRPSASRVADTASAFFRSFPIWLKVPVAGSYSSTELIDCELSEVSPPAMNTRPFVSMAVWFERPEIIDPVGMKVPVTGRTALPCWTCLRSCWL